jgi:predicted  nucleic acid-binding Zn-ribbon protein
MEQRVRQLETDVAVLGQRIETVETEVSSIRDDIQLLKKELHKAQGVIIATVVLVQALAILMEV